HSWYNLGLTLHVQKSFPGAVAAYKRALEIDPKKAVAYCNMGIALKLMGEFDPALIALQKGHELGSQQAGWSFPSALLVKECQQLVAWAKSLPWVWTGGPPTESHYLALADMCYRYKKRYADAAALFDKAFAADPRLADGLSPSHRFQAACCAALAGDGKGV